MLPIIFSCAGSTLSEAERQLFTRCQPAGFILFKRNCETPRQTKQLTDVLRDCVNQENIPILIDQEGGRVVRLDAPHWWLAPAAVSYLQQTSDLTEAARLAEADAKRNAEQLIALGINVNCAPVLDCPIPDADPVIGERAYSSSPQEIITMAEAVIRGYQAGGVVPVIKHIPGHGRALVDSHEALPVVDASRQDLCNRDFLPFQALAKSVSWAMTAHVIYTAYDTERCATISQKVIQEVIRQHIGFEGVLVTDDLSMKALSGDVVVKVRDSLAAGCDLALYCHGSLAEMESLANHIAPVEPISFLPNIS
ncbi:beta-N-acetylhexosaminidase [Okeania sp. SIO2B3]|uniref:beta-N-acetylhexosaminidase n=1 Tax=Okeania sp. SIO2B3 TaxID=2607784 RepID=UPI0013BF1232|nr:beta-N-acetylhexosaminidase [Okeania sp. SIO2B3]NET45348.1 beta-N-acetylhexosaminidase [Okeania sp. SIO2B3]